jgi:probable rRNA maturation factor
MEPCPTIDLALTSTGWLRICPGAKQLARGAAQATLVDTITASELKPFAVVEVGITLAGDAELRRLNRDYRGRDVPTNVLAFPAWERDVHPPVGGPLLLGDVVLAFETVVREAAEQRKPVADHLRHLIVHGVLHLLGYDHRTESDALGMEGLETLILSRLGVPDPYRDTMCAEEPEPVRP